MCQQHYRQLTIGELSELRYKPDGGRILKSKSSQSCLTGHGSFGGTTTSLALLDRFCSCTPGLTLRFCSCTPGLTLARSFCAVPRPLSPALQDQLPEPMLSFNTLSLRESQDSLEALEGFRCTAVSFCMPGTVYSSSEMTIPLFCFSSSQRSHYCCHHDYYYY